MPIFFINEKPQVSMKKLTVLCLSMLFAGTVQFATAQTSVNKISITGSEENSSPNFIEGISFTPDGILKTTESGGTKSIKPNVAPVVTKTDVTDEEESPSGIEKFSTIQFKYAMMLDVDVESLKNLSLFGFIENWFGTRFVMAVLLKKELIAVH